MLAGLVVALSGCGAEVLLLEVALPEGARSVIVARERDGQVEVAAANAAGEIALTPILEYDGSTPLHFTAVFYADPLEARGVAPGPMAPDPAGGTIPKGSSIQVRTVDRASDGRWEEAEALPAALAAFKTSAIAAADACVSDYTIQLVALRSDRPVWRARKLSADSVLLVTHAALDRTATGAIARLDLDGTLTYLHRDQLIPPTPACVPPSGGFGSLWIAADGEIWTSARPCGSTTVKMFRGQFGAPLTALAVQPNPELRMDALSGLGAGASVVVLGVSLRGVLWRYRAGRWDQLAMLGQPVEELVALGPDEAVGLFSDGDPVGGRTLFHYAEGRFTTMSTTNAVLAFTDTPIGPVAIEQDSLGTNAVVHRWSGAAWVELPDYPRTQRVITAAPFREGFVYSGSYGSVITYSRESGFCPSVDGKLGFDVSQIAPLGGALVFAGTQRDLTAAPIAIARPR
ncbi:MAG: hypothetical protein IT384_27105 [Deltaproteobacteria bacterium]|nr:hypothetical protein [Deltaproteobacteria bacterium]